ncbi:MAG: hypothetical protein ABJA16_06530 [Nakamurella sp.]
MPDSPEEPVRDITRPSAGHKNDENVPVVEQLAALDTHDTDLLDLKLPVDRVDVPPRRQG